MTVPNIRNAHDPETRNIINRSIDVTNELGKRFQDLVAEGQLTPAQYATLIQTVNGLISKGNVTFDDIDINRGKLLPKHASEELLSMIAGDTPINAVPADGSITTIKLAEKSVSPSKTNFMNRSKNIISGTYQNISVRTQSGTMVYDYDTTLTPTCRTEVIPIQAEKTYTVKVHGSHNTLRIGVNNTPIKTVGNANPLDRNVLVINSPASIGSEYTFTNTSEGRILLVQVSQQSEEPLLQVEEGTQATEFTYPYVLSSDRVSGLPEMESSLTNLNKEYPIFNISYQQGSIDSEGNETATGSPTRVRSSWFDLSAGDIISLVKPGYAMVSTKSYTWRDDDYTAVKSGAERIAVSKLDGSTISVEEVENVVRITTSNTVMKKLDVQKLIGSTGGSIVRYVSLAGSDDNSGTSIGEGYATLQKALDEGATTVYIERGQYYQSASGSADELTILPADKAKSDPYTEPLEKISFIGADKVENFSLFEGVYRKQITKSYPNFKSFFVDKTLPLDTGGARPQYNCIMWESRDKEMDYVLKPVLTIQELKDEVGTFFYDGTYLYINPQDVANDFYVPLRSDGINLSGTKRLKMEDVSVDYFLYTPINLDDITTVDVKNCEAHHSAYRDGFSIDYTNGRFSNCKAYKNRNDGFNLHFYGDTEFINCYGVNNYDDGISHHEHCTGVVIGGVYSGNGKAGSAPVQGAKVNHYNIIFENNRYGLLNSKAGADNISKGNVYKGNEYGISSQLSGSIITSGDVFIGNTTNISHGTDELKQY